MTSGRYTKALQFLKQVFKIKKRDLSVFCILYFIFVPCFSKGKYKIQSNSFILSGEDKMSLIE